FTLDPGARDPPPSHSRRITQGLAVGDLNNDGFVDIVSVSAADYPEPDPLVRFPVQFGSPFDATAFFIPQLMAVSPPPPGLLPAEFTWNPLVARDGSLSVNLNSADNGNGWVEVTVTGDKGLTPTGRVNRDGIGAIVKFTPDGGKTVMKPIQAGTGFASQ